MTGHRHPLSTMTSEIIDIFSVMGFSFASGPEIESEWYNFDALNVPKDHPARDMQDTFFIKHPTGEGKNRREVMRTHTSPVQVRYLEEHGAPARIISLGKVFRNEATDATHEAQFYQLEGLAVDTDVSLANLKGTLGIFFKKFFGRDVSIRFRPSFFPFVEPGVEVDISCEKCTGRGCAICKRSGWIEVMGAGMVHPNVLNAARVNPLVYQGFAFGVGVERLGMVRYGIDDVRLFHNGDLRFVNQF